MIFLSLPSQIIENNLVKSFLKLLIGFMFTVNYVKLSQLIVALIPITKYIISINVLGISLSFMPITIHMRHEKLHIIQPID